MPSSILSIGSRAFEGTAFTDFYVDCVTPPTLVGISNTYLNFPLDARIHVPVGCSDTYKTAWSTAASNGGVTLDNIDEDWSGYTKPVVTERTLEENLEIVQDSYEDIKQALETKTGETLTNTHWLDFSNIVESLDS